MSDEIERIAEGLSEAQRRSILMFRKSSTGNNLHCPAYRDNGQMARSLQAAGILSARGFATRLGKAVRTHLQEQSK